MSYTANKWDSEWNGIYVNGSQVHPAEILTAQIKYLKSVTDKLEDQMTARITNSSMLEESLKAQGLIIKLMQKRSLSYESCNK